MAQPKTVEAQYNACLDLEDREGRTRFGLMSNFVWHQDPRRLTFLLSRYKFVSKMFSGRERVLEVGCADAFGTRLVRQEVKELTAVDFDPVFIKDAQDRADKHWPVEYRVHDMLSGPVAGDFDGAYALDVLEHIKPSDEDRFLRNLTASIREQGALILGMPSLESQAYASAESKAGHVNCKRGPDFKALMSRHFHHVFMFSMNDEVVHTGYAAMAHYLLAVCATKR